MPPAVVPAWVVPPLRDVRAATDVTALQHERTKAPASLGAWSALTWIRQAPEEVTPVSKLRRDPTFVVALAEIEIAGGVALGKSYPSAEWWKQQGVEPGEVMPRSLWEELSTTGWTVEFATGAAKAFGWLTGAHERPTCMVPHRNGDGVRFTERERQVHAFQLFRLDYPDDEVRRRLTAPGVDVNAL